MTTVQMSNALVRPQPRFAPRVTNVARRMLLACGIVSALLYAAMLVFVPMRWEGYSSISQTVSELSAIGAPTRALWVLLARVYTMLALGFGLGISLSAGRNRRLRVVGVALMAQSLVSLFWPPMHLRGTAPTLTDTMHIVFAVAWLLLMLVGIGVGAAAFGKRFRFYSAATLAIFVVFGTLSGTGGPRIAANLPTPLVGAWERINIGASLAWVVVLAVMLLRRSPSVHTQLTAADAASRVQGFVAAGFEEVRAEFERNFADRGEIGAAVAAYWRGEEGCGHWPVHLLLARLPASWTCRGVRLERTRLRRTRGRRVVRLRRSGRAVGLRVRDEDDGFLPDQRPTREIAPRRTLPRSATALFTTAAWRIAGRHA